MLEQSMNYISLSKNRQAYRCYAKTPTAQNGLWTIPGLISCTVTGRWDCYLMHKMQSGGWPYAYDLHTSANSDSTNISFTFLEPSASV